MEASSFVWKDIDSAPKDGRHVLLFRPEIMFVGYWASGNCGWIISAPGLPHMWPGPTHWMELPKEPNKPRRKGKMTKYAGMNKEREIAFYEYIADAMRFASKEIGRRVDFTKYIILLPKYTSDGRVRILGNKVYLVDSLPGDFDIACPYDCTSDDEKALAKIREYREMHTFPEQNISGPNNDNAECKHERGSMVTDNGQEWFVCKHCHKKYERYF